MKTTANHQFQCTCLPVLSSRNKGWENILVEQFQHPAGEARGHRQDDNNQIAAFTLNLSRDRIPQKALPVHINLWICKDDERQIPDNLQEVEVIIKAFQYTPSST